MTEDNKITIIITFRNEGDEVEKTVQSIRETTRIDEVPIIMVDDGSDDGVDYRAVSEKYQCKYLRLPEASGGPAIARIIGAEWCATDKFAFMDGHMRLYEQNWNERVCEVLNANRRCILCSATANYAGGKEKENRGDSGAYIRMDNPADYYSAGWAKGLPAEEGNLIEVPCVLGAFYAFTRSFWEEIKGLTGLTGYGFDEPFMSLKAWYLGGKCLLLRDFYVGHLYRDKFPNKVESERFYANQMMLIDVFTLDSEKRAEYLAAFRNVFDKEFFDKVEDVYSSQIRRIEELKDYIYRYKDDENIAKFWRLNEERHE